MASDNKLMRSKTMDYTKQQVNIDRVEQARNEALTRKDIHRMALVFKVLGDATRLNIVMALGKGEMCVYELAEFLNLTESAISHHLRRLKDLSLVKNRRDGKMLYYSLDDDHVYELLETALVHIHEQ